MCLPADRQLSASGASAHVAGAAGSAGMVPVAPVTVGAPNDGLARGSPNPGATSGSSTVSSPAVTSEPPERVSLRSAVTVTADLPSDGLGVTATWADVGPTWSSVGWGAPVSRKVSMPPVATLPGSSSVWPSLSRWLPDSKRVTLVSGPVGILTRVSAVVPGVEVRDDLPLGLLERVPSSATWSWVAPSVDMGWLTVPALT